MMNERTRVNKIVKTLFQIALSLKTLFEIAFLPVFYGVFGNSMKTLFEIAFSLKTLFEIAFYMG